jgi:hypothetical protein
MATASRTLWAFSRENGLPYSKILVKVRTAMTQHYDTGADIVTLGGSQYSTAHQRNLSNACYKRPISAD